MGIEVGLISALAAAGSAAAGIYGAVQQRKAQKESNRLQEQAVQQAQKQAEDMAKANKPPPKAQSAKTPDLPAINAANMAANSKGNASTFLTGPAGVDPSSLNLGKNTLLGE